MSDESARRPESMGTTEFAYQQIRLAIVEGRYRPGQRLVEQRISEEYHLSRTPVRESLRRLEAEGLVVAERNRGAIVRPISEADIVDLYELRAPLEALAAQRAAARATPADVKELQRAITAFDDALKASGSADAEANQRVDEANALFHRCLLRIAQHSRLSELLGCAVDLPMILQAQFALSVAERVRSNLFHRLIRDAVAAHEPDRAGRLMTEHIFTARDTLLGYLRSRCEDAGAPDLTADDLTTRPIDLTDDRDLDLAAMARSVPALSSLEPPAGALR